jgi:hypothetical protein
VEWYLQGKTEYGALVEWCWQGNTEYGALVEWYWQGKTEILEHKPVTVLLYTTNHSWTSGRTRASMAMPETNRLSLGAAFLWCQKQPQLHMKIQLVPRSKQTMSVIKTSQLMLYSEIIAVCSQIHTKYINTLCGQNVPRSKHTPSQ